MESKQAELERLRRQLKALQDNFNVMVDLSEEEEINKMLDWMNELRARIKKLEA